MSSQRARRVKVSADYIGELRPNDGFTLSLILSASIMARILLPGGRRRAV